MPLQYHNITLFFVNSNWLTQNSKNSVYSIQFNKFNTCNISRRIIAPIKPVSITCLKDEKYHQYKIRLSNELIIKAVSRLYIQFWDCILRNSCNRNPWSWIAKSRMGINSNTIVGPYSLEENLMYKRFLQFSWTEAIPVLTNMFPEVNNSNSPDVSIWLQQKNALWTDVREFGKHCFSRGWIIRQGPVEWPQDLQNLRL